ncbi:hypothetical protein [Lysobacter niastensis]|uniref:Uncharacterized protein n=1 Tax=Lysobacter niastensis TaxID=380629 RepID=A0ABS0BBG2_9GAMM|nr:hypothetical protein [Lysobacter niastensis]MBF6024465.1 hypothetical protein [Lysobacter niastensis]
MTNKFPWEEIQRRIQSLRDEMPQLIEQFPVPGDLVVRFSEKAGEILEAVEEAHLDDASVLICDILFDHEYVDIRGDGGTYLVRGDVNE